MTSLLLASVTLPDFHPGNLVPFLVLLGGAILNLVVDAGTDKRGSREMLPWITGMTILLAAATFFMGFLPMGPFIENTFKADAFDSLGAVVILFSALAATIMAPAIVERRNLPSGEFYTLILFASLGAVLMAFANELLTAFVALEIMSLSLYVLAGIDRRSGRATEAAFKYFILGSFASAFLVLGIGFLFGATGTTYLNEMGAVLKAGEVLNPLGTMTAINPMWVFIGFALLFVGMCFKLTLAPFHMWAPDVYEGANMTAVTLIATASKVSSFALLYHIIGALSMWPNFSSGATFLVGMVAVVSMLWGNLAALAQTNFKRMMAYSGVAQTGYIALALMVLIALPEMGLSGVALESAQFAVASAVILYLAGYTIMSVLAFGIAHLIGGEGHMSGYRGLVHRNPIAAIGMGVAMFSLVGIGFTPPTIGFMGKFYLFKEAVQHGFTALAAIAVLASVISAFYYLNLVVTMFMREEGEDSAVRLACIREQKFQLGSSDALTRILMGSAAVLIFLFGFAPNLFLSMASTIAKGVFN